ncbi:MAG: 3-dehydroquinate synthase [Verrucomicrobia bacterium]|nr:3-dehydroquinate synthase [Kiritimatiellia bacterium]MCP5487868.1 3-dehydroquinate synthase [Verrucomicrobiota bacterium]
MSGEQTVKVALGDRSYPIRIGSGLLAGLGEACADRLTGRTVMVVSDQQVDELYGYTAEASLASAGFTVHREVVPAGETSKCAEVLTRLQEQAAGYRLDRRSAIVALGGGVVGDLAGFLAATFLRGIDFIQVPTSLLAMVDSSVGGKTGINLKQGKNLVGSFHQPRLVLADTSVLQTLPDRERRAGLAEVIKYGVIRDAGLFGFIEANLSGLLALDDVPVRHIVARSCEIKAEVVSKDETEGGVRAILNFGHTVGHAIEAVTSYGEILHGEAIAIGMVFAGRVSVRELGFPEADQQRLEALLAATGLPVRAPHCSWDALRRVMETDKKAASGIPRFVLARALGEAVFGNEVSEPVLSAVWESL